MSRVEWSPFRRFDELGRIVDDFIRREDRAHQLVIAPSYAIGVDRQRLHARAAVPFEGPVGPISQPFATVLRRLHDRFDPLNRGGELAHLLRGELQSARFYDNIGAIGAGALTGHMFDVSDGIDFPVAQCRTPRLHGCCRRNQRPVLRLRSRRGARTSQEQC